MKNIIFAVALISLSSVGAAALANNPIVGTWQITVPGTNCIETYTFKSNGVRSYTSAEEAGESKYTISSAPDSSGYYKFTDTVTKSNGKLDCVRYTSPVGDSLAAFVRIEANGNAFFFCQTESQESCVGPFVRIRRRPSP